MGTIHAVMGNMRAVVSTSRAVMSAERAVVGTNLVRVLAFRVAVAPCSSVDAPTRDATVPSGSHQPAYACRTSTGSGPWSCVPYSGTALLPTGGICWLFG
jgi:hypothetical protein